MTDYPKKLIEVSIPLKEINEASAREKSIRHGHPSTLHLWWARRPLAAARAVLFCQLVDDPSGYVEELKADKEKRKRAQHEVELDMKMTPHLSPKLEDKLVEEERDRLHKIVKKLVVWENTTDESVLKPARKEIQNSWKRTCRRKGKPEDSPMPPLLDPFAGGGAIPLEAQRLGLEAHASDLNPVAVLINKAMIEIPPKFAGLSPVNPNYQKQSKSEKAATTWNGAQGLAEDVRYYGNWMREEAKKRIGHLYPPYILSKELIESRPDLRDADYKEGQELTVIAWLWARTVPSPNPTLGGKPVPLVSSFWLSKKKGKEAYIEPVVEEGEYRFEVRRGVPEEASKVDKGTKEGWGSNFTCLLSQVPISTAQVKSLGKEGKMGSVLMAVVCEGKRGRVYLPSCQAQEEASDCEKPASVPNEEINHYPRAILTPSYGLTKWSDLFTNRQLNSLTALSDLVGEARRKVRKDVENVTVMLDDKLSLEQGGLGRDAYADSIGVYLAFAVSRLSDSCSSLAGWTPLRDTLRNTFGRHALPMVWDFAEVNVTSDSAGNFGGMLNWVSKAVDLLPASGTATVMQANASTRSIDPGTIISSDPPYYDNIGYADLSDFFYVWLRRSLRGVLPESTKEILVPKKDELIASPDRHGTKRASEAFFLNGMKKVAKGWGEIPDSFYPTTIYYAFKQAEIKKEGIASTGWATFLGALIDAELSIVGTWPVRTERPGRTREIGSAALASSIVLVCRQRPKDSGTAFKRDFIEALEDELPKALRELQYANLSPVDLPQAAIGPGMAIFSRYERVVTGDMASVTVTEALQLINHELSTILDGQVSGMDPWTRFACKWFAQYGFTAGRYGDAETMANAVDVAVDKVEEAGIIESGKGKVRILKPSELPGDWEPLKDSNRTIWEVVHHLIRISDTGSDADCAAILAPLPNSEVAAAKQLCYRLSTLSDQNGWSKESQSYNQLINNWTEYTDLASNLSKAPAQPTQTDLGLH